MAYPWQDLDASQQALLTALLLRLDKARGHARAVDRYWWQESDRALWSARQAQARVAEIFFALQIPQLQPLPDVGHKLERSASHTLLERFAQAMASGSAPAALRQAWQALQEAEQDMIGQPLDSPEVAQAIADRAVLRAHLARANGYNHRLYALIVQAQTLCAQRFLALQVGHWLLDGSGRRLVVLALKGLRVYLHDPHWRSPAQALWSCDLSSTAPSFTLCEAPASPRDKAPCYRWLLRARTHLDQLQQWWDDADWLTESVLREQMSTVLDAIAKAWWITHDPAHENLSWEREYPHYLQRLCPLVSPPLAQCCTQTAEALEACMAASVALPLRPSAAQQIECQALHQRLLVLAQQCLSAMAQALAGHMPWPMDMALILDGLPDNQGRDWQDDEDEFNDDEFIDDDIDDDIDEDMEAQVDDSRFRGTQNHAPPAPLPVIFTVHSRQALRDMAFASDSAWGRWRSAKNALAYSTEIRPWIWFLDIETALHWGIQRWLMERGFPSYLSWSDQESLFFKIAPRALSQHHGRVLNQRHASHARLHQCLGGAEVTALRLAAPSLLPWREQAEVLLAAVQGLLMVLAPDG